MALTPETTSNRTLIALDDVSKLGKQSDNAESDNAEKPGTAQSGSPLSGSDDSGTLDGESDGHNYPSGLPLVLIIVGLCLSIFLMGLDNAIISTAIPKITDEFNSLHDIGWYGSAYFLTTASLQLLFGKTYGIFPVKWVFLFAIALFEIGSLICGVAPNSICLILGRAIAGMGSAGIFSGALIIMSHSAPLEKRPMYTGIAGSMYGVSSVAGPLLGGLFTDKVTWRWCFYINLPIGAISIIAIIFFFHNPPRTKTLASLGGWKEQFWYFDPVGTLSFLPMVICLLLTLQWGGTDYAWSSARIIVLLVLFGVLLIAFVASQISMGDLATVPPRLFKISRTVWASCIFAFCVGGAFFPFTYFIPLWFQAIKGTSAVQSGIRNLPMLLGSALCSLTAGALVTVIGYTAPFMIAGSILMSIGSGLLTKWKPNTAAGVWIGYQIVLGAGSGFSLQQAILAIQTVLTLDDIPVGASLITFLLNLGGALFMSVSENLFSNKLVKGLAANVPELDPRVVVNAGATGFRKVVTEDLLLGTILAYNDALVKTFQVCTGLAAASIIGALSVEWRSVKGKKLEMAAA